MLYFCYIFHSKKKTQLKKIVNPDVKNSQQRESCASKAFGESFLLQEAVESLPTHPYWKTDHSI